MPVSGERHPTLNENGIPYVWDSRFGTYIPGNLASMSAGQAQADASARGELADPRFGPSPLAQALAANTTSTAPTQTANSLTIAVLMPDQSTRSFSINDPALDQAFQGGARPVLGGGISTDMRQFQGGWLVNYGGGYIPLNVAAGGEWLPGQREALQGAGIAVGDGGAAYNTPDPAVPPVPTPPSMTPPSTAQTGSIFPNNPPAGNPPWQPPTGTAPAVDEDLKKALMQLVQEARNAGIRGQEALTGITADLKDYLAFSRAGAEQTYAQRNELVNQLLGKVTPGIESAIGTMNEAPGLSPEANAALRTQAYEAPVRDYQGQVEQLKTSLAGRGAYGGGETPGALGEIVRGYAPLMSNRDSTRQNLLSQAILSNEQRKFDSLTLNRNTAASAMNTGAGLTSALGQIYNPASFLNANESALNGLSGVVQAGTNSQFQGLNTAGNLLGIANESDPNSWSSLLKAALLSTAANNAGTIAQGAAKLGGWIWDGIKWAWDTTVGDPSPTQADTRPTPPFQVPGNQNAYRNPYQTPTFTPPGGSRFNPFEFRW